MKDIKNKNLGIFINKSNDKDHNFFIDEFPKRKTSPNNIILGNAGKGKHFYFNKDKYIKKG